HNPHPGVLCPVADRLKAQRATCGHRCSSATDTSSPKLLRIGAEAFGDVDKTKVEHVIPADLTCAIKRARPPTMPRHPHLTDLRWARFDYLLQSIDLSFRSRRRSAPRCVL